MNIYDLRALFEKHNAEYLKFDRVSNPMHKCRDLCALLMLDKLVAYEGTEFIVSADHEIIYLGVSIDELAAVATEEDIITLVRCGLMTDTNNIYFSMFT